eukprot:TRINITY_DN1246_c0_g1_i2.p1 TRINITY_DN1246_c0_g1~~TRINITY_DN1246_c0_g1_i2.p1  ORF type:complete len:219 (-),score=64.42 TRINITY_DN1246_c0_g1_i2:366-962(-)
MLRSLVGSEMCIRDSINAEYGGLQKTSIVMVRLRVLHGKQTIPLELEDEACSWLDVKQVLGAQLGISDGDTSRLRIIHKGKEVCEQQLVSEVSKPNAKVMLITPEDPAAEASLQKVSATLDHLSLQVKEAKEQSDQPLEKIRTLLRGIDERITQQVLQIDAIATDGVQARALRKASIERAHSIGAQVEVLMKSLESEQ